MNATEWRDHIIETVAPHSLPLYPHIPEDVAHVPCLVVGHVGLQATGDRGVYDCDVTVYVIENRNPLDEVADKMLAHLEELFYLFDPLMSQPVESATPGTTSIAGQDYPTYSVTIESQVAYGLRSSTP